MVFLNETTNNPEDNTAKSGQLSAFIALEIACSAPRVGVDLENVTTRQYAILSVFVYIIIALSVVKYSHLIWCVAFVGTSIHVTVLTCAAALAFLTVFQAVQSASAYTRSPAVRFSPAVIGRRRDLSSISDLTIVGSGTSTAPVQPVHVPARSSAAVEISTLPATVVLAFGCVLPLATVLHAPH